MLERFAEVAHPMRGAHDVRVHHQRHDPRRLLRIGVQLFELIDGTVPIFADVGTESSVLDSGRSKGRGRSRYTSGLLETCWIRKLPFNFRIP